MRSLDVLVAGRMARDLVLTVPDLPGAHAAARVGERQETLGGKGANLAVASAQLGQRVALLGVVGDDEIGGRLIARAELDRIDCSPVVRRPGAATGLIVDVLEDDGRWHYLEDLPPSTMLTLDDAAHAARRLRSANSMIVELQQPPEVVADLVDRARAADCRVVLDGLLPDAHRAALLRACDVLRADHREARLLTGDRLDTAAAGIRAARSLLRYGPALVVLDIGDGTVFAWGDEHLVLPQIDTPVVDTTGAGDAFTATLTAARNHGLPPPKAARWAVAAAAATVGHPGGRPRLTADILRHYLGRLKSQAVEGV